MPELFDDMLRRHEEQLLVIHGNCRGADRYFARRAAGSDYVVVAMPARWDVFGRAAGYRRNSAMIRVLEGLVECGWRGVGLAMPKGSSPGTRDTVARFGAVFPDLMRVYEL